MNNWQAVIEFIHSLNIHHTASVLQYITQYASSVNTEFILYDLHYVTKKQKYITQYAISVNTEFILYDLHWLEKNKNTLGVLDILSFF